jgi:hypothetical protein
MDKHFGGVIWTNHVLQRLEERGVSQGEALSTLKHPERSRYAAVKSAWVYNRTINHRDIEVVATQNEKREWVVMSVWPRTTYRNNYRYLERNGLIDWLLDKIEAFFTKKRK